MAIPNTNTFDMAQVATELGGTVLAGDNLNRYLIEGRYNRYDSLYRGNLDRLSNFRNYARIRINPAGLMLTRSAQTNTDVTFNQGGQFSNQTSIPSWITTFTPTISTASSGTFTITVTATTSSRSVAIDLRDDSVAGGSNGLFTLVIFQLNTLVKSYPFRLRFASTAAGICTLPRDVPQWFYANSAAWLSATTLSTFTGSSYSSAPSGFYEFGNDIRQWNGSSFVGNSICS